MPQRNKYRRGYPVAVLVSLNDDQAVIWKIFSQVAKPDSTIRIEGSRKDAKAVYSFHESIVNLLRPTLKEGVKSVILVSPPRTGYGTAFQKHIQDHHSWLVQGTGRASFAQLTGSAQTMHETTMLTRTAEFHQIVGETTTEENENLIEILEKRLNAVSSEPLVLYALDEIENAVYCSWKPSKPHPEFLIITDTYLSKSRQRNRVQRLLQIASNNNVKTRIVKSETPAGKRVIQLGGLVCVMMNN